MAISAFPPTRRAAGAVFSVGLAALVLTACGAAEFSSDSAGGLAEQSALAPESADSARGENGDGAAEEQGDSSPLGSEVEIGDRKLIHTADLTVRVDDVPGTAEQAKELALDAGGYIASETLSTPTSDAPDASLVLRVPVEGYEDALTALGELGDRSNLERSVEDVTEEVADVESRIESSEVALETLRGYLEEAEDVDDLLRVESEIQTRQSELEAFQARLESLTDRTTYSTVNLHLMPPETYLEQPSEEGIGFLGGLERGWRAMVSLGQGIAVVVGWLLPFLVAATVLGAGPLWWYRSRRPRRDKGGKDDAGLMDAVFPHGTAAGGSRAATGASAEEPEDGTTRGAEGGTAVETESPEPGGAVNGAEGTAGGTGNPEAPEETDGK